MGYLTYKMVKKSRYTVRVVEIFNPSPNRTIKFIWLTLYRRFRREFYKFR